MRNLSSSSDIPEESFFRGITRLVSYYSRSLGGGFIGRSPFLNEKKESLLDLLTIERRFPNRHSQLLYAEVVSFAKLLEVLKSFDQPIRSKRLREYLLPGEIDVIYKCFDNILDQTKGQYEKKGCDYNVSYIKLFFSVFLNYFFIALSPSREPIEGIHTSKKFHEGDPSELEELNILYILLLISYRKTIDFFQGEGINTSTWNVSFDRCFISLRSLLDQQGRYITEQCSQCLSLYPKNKTQRNGCPFCHLSYRPIRSYHRGVGSENRERLADNRCSEYIEIQGRIHAVLLELLDRSVNWEDFIRNTQAISSFTPVARTKTGIAKYLGVSTHELTSPSRAKLILTQTFDSD